MTGVEAEVRFPLELKYQAVPARVNVMRLSRTPDVKSEENLSEFTGLIVVIADHHPRATRSFRVWKELHATTDQQR